MKLIKLSVDGLPLFKDKIDIDFYTEQKVMSDNNEMLSNPFGKIYLNNILSVVGINASGKTSLLKVITFALNFLNGESINNIKSRDILNYGKSIVFDLIFYDGKENIYRLKTNIKSISENEISYRYVINEETLYRKKITKIRSKKDLLEYIDSDIVVKRDKSELFLKDDISVVISVNKDYGFKIRDLISTTNLNILRNFGYFPKEIINFLDPSIKNLNFDKNTNECNIEFYNGEKIRLSDPVQLEKYLSSGTIKGINIFINAFVTFKDGGYLIVDELENHFNREIVATLMRFFISGTVNPNGSTLVFSTHYSELLDEIERNDSIYIVRNRGGITTQKLYDILKRNDIKKSEAFKSGYLDGVIPSYDAYIKLKSSLIKCNCQ